MVLTTLKLRRPSTIWRDCWKLRWDTLSRFHLPSEYCCGLYIGNDIQCSVSDFDRWLCGLASQSEYAAALSLYETSHAIRKAALGPEHPDVAQSLNNLADIFRQQVGVFH